MGCWFVEVLVVNGVVVSFIDKFVLILVVMFKVKVMDCVYLVCIIVLYNLVDYNGIKVFICGGCDVDEVII